jgi:hypothetical protein
VCCISRLDCKKVKIARRSIYMAAFACGGLTYSPTRKAALRAMRTRGWLRQAGSHSLVTTEIDLVSVATEIVGGR